MKKIILGFMTMVLLGNASMAQHAPKTTAKSRAEVTQQQAVRAEPNAAASGPMKKDGTPDMRHKANRAKVGAAPTVTPSGPTKKDGTPDRRHKANKDAAAASGSSAK